MNRNKEVVIEAEAKIHYKKIIIISTAMTAAALNTQTIKPCSVFWLTIIIFYSGSWPQLRLPPLYYGS